ncbi:hypothetical protein [Ruminococcus sp. Marseille-P328]|uniref:hypothetical protein n=1 Tax=Ruminococcus sp. Marseille-P328 TaxID=1816688 RepID=UPI003566D731
MSGKTFGFCGKQLSVYHLIHIINDPTCSYGSSLPHSDCSAGHKILAGSQGVQGINTRTGCLTAGWPECI